MTVRQQPQRIHLSLPVPSRAMVYIPTGFLGAGLFAGGCGGLDQVKLTSPEALPAVGILLLGALLLRLAIFLHATRPGGAR